MYNVESTCVIAGNEIQLELVFIKHYAPNSK